MYTMIAQYVGRLLLQTWLFKVPVQDMTFDPVAKLHILISMREASKAGLQTT